MKPHTEDIKYSELPVDEKILNALDDMGITHPTEIQAKAIPQAVKGNDVIGRAITGSGKTLAFSIPIIQEFMGKTGRGIKAIILCPTRELAKQVDKEFRTAGKHTEIKTALIYGGVKYEPQFDALEVADIVIGTPGRIMDHMERGTLDLSSIEFFVLDEADRMLDMGFIDDIRKIIEETPIHKQNFFFSATMPSEARDLAQSFMHEPVDVSGAKVYVDQTRLKEYYLDATSPTKPEMLKELLRREKPELALVFANTRNFVQHVADYLNDNGYNAKAMHGGHAQNKRERIMDRFDEGNVDIMVATDVAARGIDVTGITHVINYDVPKGKKTYTHRIGRTARAGKSGKAFTFVMNSEHGQFSRIEGDSQRDIQKYRLDGFTPKKHYFHNKRKKRRGRRR